MTSNRFHVHKSPASWSTPVKKHQPTGVNWTELLSQIRQKISPIINKCGIHSVNRLKAAGLYYVGNGDTAYCNDCGLEVSNWTLDMDPWLIHSTQRSDCPFVLSMRSHLSSEQIALLIQSRICAQKKLLKNQKAELIDYENPLNTSVEADLYRRARKHTYSEWENRPTLSSRAMIDAGFISCNINDRVMCIHCNLSCHDWTPHVDEPCDVHKTLSPQCPYVKQFLSMHTQPRILNNNQTINSDFIRNGLSVQTASNSIPLSSNLSPSVQVNINRNTNRSVDFSSTQPIDEIIRADTADQQIQHDEKCTTCQKSLQNIDRSYYTTTDIARWFVHCAHSKQFTADEIFSHIKKCQDTKEPTKNNATSNSGLNLSIPRQILCETINQSVLQRIWGNEFEFKPDDSDFDAELLLSCIIFQKQIDHLDGKIENIQIPADRIREVRQEAANAAQRYMATIFPCGDTSNCLVCCRAKKELVCMPCRHLITCVQCHQSIQSCPRCREEIKAFIRVFL